MTGMMKLPIHFGDDPIRATAGHTCDTASEESAGCVSWSAFSWSRLALGRWGLS